MKMKYMFRAVMVAGALAVAGCAEMTTNKSPDIVDVAQSAGSFNTLVAAVGAAGLVDTLKSEGPFTVFAPTDEAFAALPAGTVETLLKPENKDKLTAILTYHVLPGKVMAADIVGKRLNVATVNGKNVHVNGRGKVVHVNKASVISADVPASNGVIHVIDKVLLP
jgi:uncharacterized surface protein with fasciclin (FAS1) repeats